MAVEQQEIMPSPIAFVEGDLGLSLYGWQDKAISALEAAEYGQPLIQVSLLAPNESGKSSRVVAGSACYLLARGFKVGITTKDGKQLNEQIIPAIEAQIYKFAGWKSVKSPYYRIETPSMVHNGRKVDGAVLIAFTTDDAHRVEGLHGTLEHPLCWIVDEAKAVEEKIFSGIDRCGYQALIYVSSGGLKMGSFWESQYGKTSEDFIKIRVGLKDCPHIAPEKIDRIIKKYGEQSPFTRSCVYGEFMDQSDDDEYCLTLSALLGCLQNPPKHRRGEKKMAFLDFGGGSAEHVFAVRDGNKIEIAAAWIESNKDAAAGRFIREFIKAGVEQDQIECDASDKEIWQKLANAGWNIRRRNFGAPPRLKKEYLSYGAEIWLEGAIQVGLCQWILPDDDLMKSQAISRKKGYTGAGKLCVEDKISMAERGIPSPDRWDAICGVMAMNEPIRQREIFTADSWKEYSDKEETHGILEKMGASAGM